MFETMTYETILMEMLDRVTSDVDKREGSILYDALAPSAYELAQTYFNLSNFLDLVSGDTAVGEYLDRVVADYGITRKQATKAVRKVIATEAVSIGTRWGLEGSAYHIIAHLGENTYQAECEQDGEIGNRYNGALLSLDNLKGVTATLGDIIIAGEEVETDKNLRARFYTQVQSPSTSGNADNYKKWALEVPGVGDAKVYPLWNGNGTVKVIIVDSNMSIDRGLEKPVFDYIETVRPIGATVTVTSPSSIKVSVSAKIILDGTKLLQEVIESFTNSFAKYLKDTIFASYVVSYARVGSLILATEGISDYSELLINGKTSNIAIAETEMPMVGTIELAEVVSE